MGFRSYIRQFLGAILMLFRPSLPWGFAAGSGSILGVATGYRSSRSRSRSSSSSRKQEEKVATIIFSIGFRRVAGAAAAPPFFTCYAYHPCQRWPNAAGPSHNSRGHDMLPHICMRPRPTKMTSRTAWTGFQIAGSWCSIYITILKLILKMSPII